MSAMDPTRRTFLGIAGAAVALPPAEALSRTLSAHGMSLPPLMNMCAEPSCQSQKPELFTSFADWWARFGERRSRGVARQVSHLDVDILSMRAPSLQAKVEMQLRRDAVAFQKEWRQRFDSALSLKGVFEWWP